MMKRISEEVTASFKRKGIDVNTALLLVQTDMAREEHFCDAYTAFTREGIATLFCLKALRKREGASLFSPVKSKPVLEELEYLFIPLGEIESIKVEELVSVFRVVLTRKDQDAEVLFYASFATRKEVYEFSDAVNEFLKSGEVPRPKKRERGEAVCPHCHTPYSDPQRKICKKCLSRRNLVKKLLPFFYRYKKQMALVFLTVFLSGLLSVIVPYLKSKVLYDQILTPGNSLYGKVGLLVLSVAGAGLLSAFVTMINSIIGSRVSAFVTYDLKKTIFSSFERLSYSFFTSRHTGRLITQINSDAETLYWFFCDGVPYLLTNVLQMIAIAVVMLSIHPLLTLVVMLPIPLLFLGYVLVLRMFRRLHAENHTHRSRFNSVLSDVLGGMRIVKAFSRENEEIERFDEKSQKLYSSKLSIDIRHHTIFPLLNLGMRLTNYLVWGFGGYFVLHEMLTPGSGISYGVLSLFISYLTMLYTPLNFFANFFSQMAGGLNALQRLFEILETEPEVKEKKDAVDLVNVEGRVEFDQVCFSYQPGKKTIDHVSFSVPAGKTLGIVGHSGAGKSTLVNLLTRLYDVSEGVIRIDGKDVRDLTLATLRRNVAIVSQETYLFRGTIMDNIRYARPEASAEDVIRASRAAGCHDFIMALPDGYETYVGSDQRTLSGGEKQRISIARAILKDPAILILDEATAAMDTKTERRIQASLAAITKNRTTITIAHRLSTIRDADFLIVIEDGKKVEEGTHEELLEKEGAYHNLYRLQMEALKIIGIEE